MDTFDHNHLWHPYASVPNKVETYKVLSADGVYLSLEDNARVIDGMSSWWSVIHGYNHPVLNQAIKDQADKVSHVMFGGLTHDPAIQLAKTLVSITPEKLDKVFFADSGSVAVEVAMKMSVQYWYNKGYKQKSKFITPLGGYHGDTFGAMSVCDPENGMHYLFADNLAKHYFVMRPTVENTTEALESLENTLKENHNSIAAMIIEPIVQGAGGMNIYSSNYLLEARSLCDKFDVLLILDEIATGFGRTGKLFALEYANIVPDILCLGKALTGGYMTLAATLTNEEISSVVGTLMHGPTFMANPLACSVANASLNLLLDSNWQEDIKRIEQILKTELLPLIDNKNVADVRVKGAIGVLELTSNIDVESVQRQLINSGVWLRPYGKLLYTMPPFVINNEELLTITSAMKNIVDDL